LGYDAAGHATATVGDSYGYDVTAKPTSYAAGWIGDQRALEVATSYEGSGAPRSKSRPREKYSMTSTGTRKSARTSRRAITCAAPRLGGKVVAELAPNGARMKNHLYAGGMELAQPFVYQNTTYVNWQHTDPVTGGSFTTDTTRTLEVRRNLAR